MSRSHEIVEIIGDVVRAAHLDCEIVVDDFDGHSCIAGCPELNYVFGNARYVKGRLDTMSRSTAGTMRKLPLIALFTPFNEQRNSADYYAKAKVRVLIACSTRRDWSNEQRLQKSFVNILRPIYRSFLKALMEDGRLDFGYQEVIPHEYSENYSIGKYGAHTGTPGEELSEPIDAINIINLELKVKQPNCREL